MPAKQDLFERSGDLKRRLVAFSHDARFAAALRRAFQKHFGGKEPGSQGQLVNFYDYFMLQHRLPDGGTVFVAFFGSDLVVLPGHQLAERMQAYHRFCAYEVRDAEGTSAAERAKRAYGIVPSLPEFRAPENLRQAETVGVIYDEVDGLQFFSDFGFLQETFARPKLAADREHREAVLAYLKEPSITPLALRRLAEPDPERASRVFRQVLKRPRFSWQRDGEALLRRYKTSHFKQPVWPCVLPTGGEIGRARMDDLAGRSHEASQEGGETL